MNPRNIETIDELSPMQQAMLLHSLMVPGSGMYVLQTSLRLTGRLDLAAFERAWRHLVARHSILRTAFFWEDLETPRQVVFRQVELEIERASWRGLGAAGQEERLGGFLAADRARGFELGEAPLLRLALFELAEDVHQLVWTQHHLLTDGWSQGLVLWELLRLYEAFTAGREPALPPAPGFHDYLSWLQRQDLGAAEAFWRRSLEGFSTPTFLAIREGRTEEPEGTQARRRDLALSESVSTALREVARRRRLTLNTLVQGSWALLLAQESGREDVVFGATVAGRPADLPGVEAIAGPFLNTLPVRVEVAPGLRLQAWLAALQARQAEARRHEHAPLIDVQRWSGLEPGVALFDHILVFENLVLPEELASPVPGLEIAVESASSLTNYPLDVVVLPGRELLISLRWDGARYGEPEAVRLQERLARLLAAFAEDGDPRLGELPLLLPAERHQLLREWNDTAGEVGPDLLMHQFFERRADAAPGAPAAVWEDEAWSYAELEERANRLARLLRGRGVERGTPVGVWMERSLHMLAAVLGILKAGGTYVPLDIAWPAGRVEAVLAGTGAPAVVAGRTTLRTVDEIRWRLPRLGDVICPDIDAPEPGPEPLDAASLRSLFDFVAERAAGRNDRVMAGGFVSRATGLPFREDEVDEYRDRVLSLAAPWLRPGAWVLEVGCGSGLIFWEMARRAGHAVGLDPSEQTQERNREHARERGLRNVELPVGFAHEIGELFPPGSFDLVVLASTAQFFPGPRYLERVVADALRLLAPEGALLVADVIDARRGPAAAAEALLALDEDLFQDLGTAEIHRRTEGFANELGERYDVILRPGEPRRRKRTWTGWHVERCPATRLPAVGSPEDIAYVIHTSGSTGEPKGIAVQHAAAANLIDWVNRTFGVGPGDRSLFVTSLGFDLSVYDVFGVLAAGATVHVASEEDLREPERLVRLLREEPVTLWDSAPAALQQLAPLFPAAERPLRLVLLSGDWIPVRLPDEVRAAFPGARVVSLGGATEATVWSNWYPVGEVDPSWPSIPYGRPIANARYHVLDGSLRPCPIGVPGDLYIGGACLCVGYAGQPETTAAAFVPDPFAREPGARLYRAGDRARFFPDGNLEILGRIDQQVKIRGYRIEPGEIEAALLRHPAVREAVVLPREDCLVAYLVPRDGEAPEAGALRAFLGTTLPSYMVPSAFVALPALPVTAHGKLDRQALPMPDRQAAGEGYLAPRTQVEEVVAGIWAELLGIERVGVADRFFDLGGHSLLATRFVSRLRGALGVELPVRALFERPTVAELSAAVEEARGGTDPLAPPLVPVPRTGPLPLSFAQRRLWFLDQLEPGSPLYNVPLALRVEGPLDRAVLALCLGEIIRRHEVLRTAFATREGSPVQIVQAAAPFVLPLIDLSGLPETERESQVLSRVREEAVRPFDLARVPLLRGVLLRLGEGSHIVALTLHHIASDGWSLGLLVREMGILYAAFAEGRPSPLPELPLQYADFAVWQGSWLRGEVLEEEISFWRRQLAGLPPLLDLPTDRPRPAARSFRGSTRPLRLPAALTSQVGLLARREGATLFMVLLAAFQALLARQSGQDDLAVGSPVAGRDRIETEGLIGFFVNTLVLRGDLGGEPSFSELLGRVRETSLDAYLHQKVPFERLVEELAPERSLAHSPLFQVMFTLKNAPSENLEIAGLRLRPVGGVRTTAKFDLTMSLGESEGELAGTVEHAAALFDATTIGRLISQYETLLTAALAAPDLPVAGLPMLGAGERHQLLQEWSDTAASFPWEATIHGLFAGQAERRSTAVAVEMGDEKVTWDELRRRAGRIARRLAARGLRPEERVAVLAGRSPDLIAALLGILQAGGAYLPLDPALPAERLAWMLSDAGASLFIAHGEPRIELPAGIELLDLLDLEDGGGPEVELPRVPAESLAYVMYTSGSTGTPKGVAVTHRNVVRLVRGAGYADLGPDQTWLQAAPVSFDASTLEIWAPLLKGGRLVLFPRQAGRLGDLAEVIAAHGVTSAWLTAGLFHEMVDGCLEGLRPLAQLLVGGDVVSPEHARRALATHPGLALIDGYGPTEGTTFTCCHRLTAAAQVEESLPIGRPIANARVYVLDAHGEPAPVGVPGELFVGGEGLARGYLGRPDLTAERFVPDAFGEPGGRLYRTGDRVRRRPDGLLEFLGRFDHQVKIRGFRVEPGEIEAALALLPGVREAAVLAVEASGGRRLAAYLVGEAPPDAELRRLLSARLPAYMMPSAFVRLAALPLTPNGKVDRRALPAPEIPGGAAAWVAPRTPVEELLVEIWADVLGLERVGAADDFFTLGGHSLLAVRLMTRIEHVFGVKLPLSTLLEAPTVEHLARAVQRPPARRSMLVRLHPGGSGRPFFLIHPAGGHVFDYVPLARKLGEERPVYGLQAVASGNGHPVSMEELATQYLESVREVQPEGPWLLAGWSSGAVMAYEMARQTGSLGGTSLLTMFDPASPPDGRGEGADDTVLLAGFAALEGLSTQHQHPFQANQALLQGLDVDTGIDRLVEAARAAGVLRPDVDEQWVRERFALFRRTVTALYNYRPLPYGGRVTLFRAGASLAPGETDVTSGWGSLARTEAHLFPEANHYTLLHGPALDRLMEQLRSDLALAGA